MALTSLVEDQRVEINLNFQRKLYADDLKMLWLITQRCNKYLFLNIRAEELQKEDDFLESDIKPKTNILKKLMLNRKNVCSYKYFDNIEERINFQLLIKFAYISFVLNLILCILVPIVLKHPEWGKGSYWAAHLIFAIYIVSSFFIEMLVFRVWFSKSARDTLYEGNRKWMAWFIMSTHSIIGLIAKGDIYTDIAFLVEMQKCNAEKSGIYGGALLLISALVFLCTIGYQIFWFLRLIMKLPKSTFCPLTSHTTRLLMCADFKFLAMAVDKFSVTYYERFLWWRVPTFKILALFKLIFEDIIQWALQVIYLFLASEKDKNLLIIIISLCFSFPAILSSVLALIYNKTSSLTTKDYDDLVRSK